jgi:uncharacterized membrane protein
MQKPIHRLLLVGLFAILFSTNLIVPVHAQEEEGQPVVRAVLFYSPSCGHCENLIQNQLPPLLAQYGDQLKIVAINTSLSGGQELYLATVEKYQVPEERIAVPMLIVADKVMVGGNEIPSQFPGIIEEELSTEGTEWPDITGLSEVIAGVQFSSNPGSASRRGNQVTTTNGQNLSIMDKFKLDPLANSIAVIVLIGMVISIFWVIIRFTRPVPEKDFWPKWIIPIVSFFGMGVAFYLTYVETSGVEAACGPVGDCNTVQLSPYAVLFGILPVGLLGLIGYALILAGWAVYHFGPKRFRWAAAIAVWGMAFFGVLFSIYLTFLEPFVIGATCMWCISSAIFQTIIFLAATDPAKRAWQDDDYDYEDFEEYESIDPKEAST